MLGYLWSPRRMVDASITLDSDRAVWWYVDWDPHTSCGGWPWPGWEKSSGKHLTA